MQRRAAFGDFQTPAWLARDVLAWLQARGVRAASVLEPTAGAGAFLEAAASAFPSAALHGIELDADHLASCARSVPRATLDRADVFAYDFDALASSLPEPVLLLGNPPWVTNAAMPRLGGDNLPPKSTPSGVSGLDARTGKANFDVAEWILARLFRAFAGKRFTAAFLVKTQVARRLLVRASSEGWALGAASLVPIDARVAFGATVDACLFVVASSEQTTGADASVFAGLSTREPTHRIGVRDGMLVADLDAHERAQPFLGTARPEFRSGIKHDCAPVLELLVRPEGLSNGLGERVDVEPEVLFPLIKGGDLDASDPPERMLLLPQTSLGDDERRLAERAPRALAYLERHRARFERRASSIYRGRPTFAVFGLGAYTFAPYKVAIFGLGKRPRFHLLAPRDGRPVVLDDTAYFMSFDTEAEAAAALRALDSPEARDVLAAFFFADAKRPITKQLLMRFDLDRLGRVAG